MRTCPYMSLRCRSASVYILTALAVGGSLLVPAASIGASVLHSPEWLYKHCPIRVSANAPDDKPDGQQDGVTLRGRLTNSPAGRPETIYHWRIPKNVRLCGITGSWPQPSREKTLKPTVETARGGEYIDHSASNLNATKWMGEFAVYARPISR
jgi:hypothetical protein